LTKINVYKVHAMPGKSHELWSYITMSENNIASWRLFFYSQIHCHRHGDRWTQDLPD